MLKEILTRCGYRCDLCLAYKDNIENDDQRDILSDTWHKIYGFKIPAEKILCEGCISCDTPKLIDSNCPVRPCVIENGLENCSQCKKFPCDLFNQRKVVYQDFTKNKNISRKEYSRCIKPYENNERLNEIRKNNFPFSRLFNSEIIPNYDSILKFISNRQTVNYWLDLMSFIDNLYYELDKKILFGGKKYGWAVQWKRNKKTIVTAFPERESFTVLLILGKSELAKIGEKKGKLTQSIINMIDKTRQYQDGKWVWIRCKNKTILNNIKELIMIKRKPDV